MNVFKIHLFVDSNIEIDLSTLNVKALIFFEINKHIRHDFFICNLQ